MLKKYLSIKTLRNTLAGLIATFLVSTSSIVQALEEYTYVSPSPSAINSYPVFVAIGE